MPKTPGEHFGFTRQWILTTLSVMYDTSIESGIEFENLANRPDLISEIINESNSLINSNKGNIPMNNITPNDVILLLNHQL